MKIMHSPLFSKRFQTTMRWGVIAVLWLIILSVVIGKSGIVNFMQLMNERDILLEHNRQLQVENQLLEEKIILLRSSNIYAEHYLKQNFGYVERNEYVYQFKK